MSTGLFVQDDDVDMETNHDINKTNIPEDDEQQQQFQLEETQEKIDEDENDPVIQEIPIIMKSIPSNSDIVLLQYPGRSKNREFINQSKILGSRIKENSRVVEIDTPIDTNKFYDEQFKYNSDLENLISKQSLKGNLLKTDGYYFANVVNDQLILYPINETAQLRQSLDYIDKDTSQRKEAHHALNNQNYNGNGSGVQVVQMTVKGASDNAPRLGGALLSKKNADEEEYTNYKWHDVNNEENLKVKETLFDLSKDDLIKPLVSKTNKNEYVDLLVKEIFVE
ncbi:hypothetical protein WICMUC_005971 [Wickerhamomyces mucosus]|uniref:Uncharacterized protein n=1 Tax=Wickerhamomyces mucosus TaxID=1378264 RepID=A0A9P8P1K3_9ASCO|nr:hypothetical protein WICMUC_005971 [Wickerhamomyces mucosus]